MSRTHPASRHQPASHLLLTHTLKSYQAQLSPLKSRQEQRSSLLKKLREGAALRERQRREGDEDVKAEWGRETTVPICQKEQGRLNKLPPTWSFPSHGSIRAPVPREREKAWKRCRITLKEDKEGSQRREKTQRRGRGKKATTVGCPTQLQYRDDVGGHVTQGLQWRHMEGRKETSFKAGAFWVVWGLCSPSKQPQNHRRAARVGVWGRPGV